MKKIEKKCHKSGKPRCQVLKGSKNGDRFLSREKFIVINPVLFYV